MKTAELREVALMTVRVEMRRLGIDPVKATVEDAQDIMEEIAAQHPQYTSVIWFKLASQSQLRLFDKEFKKWQKERTRLLEH